MDLTDHANEPGIFTVLDVSARRAAGAHVSVGSKGNVGLRPDYVCATPENGHRRKRMRCRLCANSRPDWAYRSRPLSGASNTMGILTARLSVRVVVATVRGD